MPKSLHAGKFVPVHPSRYAKVNLTPTVTMTDGEK